MAHWNGNMPETPKKVAWYETSVDGVSLWHTDPNDQPDKAWFVIRPSRFSAGSFIGTDQENRRAVCAEDSVEEAKAAALLWLERLLNKDDIPDEDEEDPAERYAHRHEHGHDADD